MTEYPNQGAAMAKNKKRKRQRRKKRRSKIKKPIHKSSHVAWQLIWVTIFIVAASSAYFSVGANCAGGEGAQQASITRMPQQGVVYFLDDHLGNTHLVTDSLGNVVHEESRYPYGVKKHEQNTAANSEAINESKPYYSYTGKEYDEETGLVYFGGRYYSPEMGRWITPDPLFLSHEVKPMFIKTPEEHNLYSYVQNNPTTHRDEDGFKTTITIQRDSATEKSISGRLSAASDIVSDTYSARYLQCIYS